MTLNNVLDLVRSNIASLEPYSTARDEYKGTLGTYLDANENPYENGVNRYPSTSLKERVRNRIATLKGVAPEQLFLGNGSDEAIDLCYRIFCEPGVDNAIVIAPSYGMYSVCAAINDVECRQIQLNADFSLPTEALLAAADEHSKLLFLCSPNNPTANAFPQKELLEVIRHFKGVVVVDEAYIDFSSVPSLVPLLDKHPNLIVLQTLSKAYGLAGLRIGLAMAHPRLISLFRQVKYPYNIGTDTLGVADQALQKEVAGQIRTLIGERNHLEKVLTTFSCIEKVYPSDTNFLLVKTPQPRALYDHLIANGLIVRDRSKVKGCEGTLRITVGTSEENCKLIQVIQDYDRQA